MPVQILLAYFRVTAGVGWMLPVVIVMLSGAAGAVSLFPFPAAESSHYVDAAEAVAGGSRADGAGAARAAFPRGSLAIRIRDQLGAWCEDEAFAGVYGIRGAPGISPAQLAVVTALQFAENLTDRQAADEMRGRIDWK